eukprot:6143-Chlamydomonas_euryale.AAC.4
MEDAQRQLTSLLANEGVRWQLGKRAWCGTECLTGSRVGQHGAACGQAGWGWAVDSLRKHAVR